MESRLLRPNGGERKGWPLWTVLACACMLILTNCQLALHSVAHFLHDGRCWGSQSACWGRSQMGSGKQTVLMEQHPPSIPPGVPYGAESHSGEDPASVPPWDCSKPQAGISCDLNMTVRSAWIDLRQPSVEFLVEMPLRHFWHSFPSTGWVGYTDWAYDTSVECLLVDSTQVNLLLNAEEMWNDEGESRCESGGDSIPLPASLQSLAEKYNSSLRRTTIPTVQGQGQGLRASRCARAIQALSIEGHLDGTGHIWTYKEYPYMTHVPAVARCFLPPPHVTNTSTPSYKFAYTPLKHWKPSDDFKRNEPPAGPNSETAFLAAAMSKLQPVLRINNTVVIVPHSVDEVWWTPFHNTLPKHEVQVAVAPIHGDPPFLEDWLATQKDLGARHVYMCALKGLSPSAVRTLSEFQAARLVTLVPWKTWYSKLSLFYYSQQACYDELLYRAMRHVHYVEKQEGEHLASPGTHKVPVALASLQMVEPPSHLFVLDTDDFFVGKADSVATYTRFLRTHAQDCAHSCNLAWVPYYVDCGKKQPTSAWTADALAARWVADSRNPAHSIRWSAIDYASSPYSNSKAVHNLRSVFGVGTHKVMDTLRTAEESNSLPQHYPHLHVAHARASWAPPKWFRDYANITACTSRRTGLNMWNKGHPRSDLLAFPGPSNFQVAFDAAKDDFERELVLKV